MIVMPANNTKVHELATQYPHHVGMLMGPDGWKNPRGLPFALDNGRFATWSTGKSWSERKFQQLVEKSLPHCPRWVVVPDVVGDADATFQQWQQWSPRLAHTRRALAVQDGMTPTSVRKYCDPDIIFVGGTTNWKRRTIWQWCHEFPRVHVGRINTEKWLWNAARCGAESCDGTGWFRGDQQQLRGLHRFLARVSRGVDHPQMQLEFARTFVKYGHVPSGNYVK